MWSVPAALLLVVAWLLAWRENGSIDAADWLPYAVFCLLLLVVVLLSGRALLPSRAGLVGAGGLLGLAGWTAISLVWSPLPEQARNDALLASLYAFVFLIALIVGAPGKSRAVMLGVTVGGLGALGVATELKLALGAHPTGLYSSGRLFFPIGYWNAQAAMFLIAFWPLIALGARRSVPVVLRALACGAAASVLAGAVMVQSKGGVIALVVSAIVVLAVAKDRLRILAVLLLSAAPVLASYRPLTRPFRAWTSGASVRVLDDAIHSAATWAVVLSAGVAVLGGLWALADSRTTVSPRARRAAAILTACALAVGLLGGISAAFVRVDHPVAFLQDKWHEFTHRGIAKGGSHFASLGSSRWDFWRVAGSEFVAHPLAGIGQHGFAAAYLEKGRSVETPQRAHSVFLDQLSETGLIGFALLLVGIGAPLWLVARRARGSILHAGILGSAIYWLVHSAGDWIWTFPAVGIPLFLMLGIGASSESGRPLRTRVGLAAAVVPAAVALFAFVPPWLSARFTDEALSATPSGARNDLRWARRLDPLAVGPYLAEAELAPTFAGKIPPLSRAVRLEPRSVTNWYLLGLVELKAGRRREARRDLLAARALYPRDEVIARALARARMSARPPKRQ